MALLNVTNDLRTPVEVRLRSEEWELVYPKMSCDVKVADTAVTCVEIRLVESPEVKGSCQARSGSSLWASVDFDSFSRQAKGRDRAEARELAREGKRREEARKRTEAMIKEAAAKKRDKKAWSHVAAMGIFAGLPFALLLVCVSIPPESTVAAALLASATVPLCCCISISSFFGTSQNEDEQFKYGKYHTVLRVGLRLVGILALLSLAAMTVQHTLRGYWWTAVIAWPVAICGGVMFCVCCFVDVEMDDEQRKTLEREREEAHCEVSNRSIRFEGSVLCEPGRPCVASWPGKYEGAWESLVSQGRNGEVSAAVVFLPQGTEDYGQCDSIPEAEGLPGTCWCTPLYGEQKPWGCRWFTKWRENIETAVESGAELEVYYFQRHVGKGQVESFESAGKDNLQRERVNKKQKEFEESPPFEQALNAGLGNLSKDPRGDGSSQYSREVRRLFLASLPEAEREFITSAEGLGNSQKAEVAWLEKKGYEYWGVDVSTWLPGEGVEICVPASAEWQAQVCDVSPISVSVAKE